MIKFMIDWGKFALITEKIIFILAVIGICFLPQLASANELALGQSSKITGPIDIPIVPPADFNFKTKAEILQIRKREVLKHPELLKGTYIPDEQVFGRIEDKKPWWGIFGQAYYGAGQNSIRGPAEESRFILNPFLLAGEPATEGMDKSRVSASDLETHNYPTFYQPTGLRWWPKESKAEVTY